MSTKLDSCQRMSLAMVSQRFLKLPSDAVCACMLTFDMPWNAARTPAKALDGTASSPGPSFVSSLLPASPNAAPLTAHKAMQHEAKD